MKINWEHVSLGDVLQLSLDIVPVDASATYSIAGVYSFGKGLFTRESLSGSATTYKVFHRLHKGHLVLSQLKAWEGALAKVPSAYEGKFLSPQFATFSPVLRRLNIDYLSWYCKQPTFWHSLRNASRGMGDRRDSVSPARFLAQKIPLPPLVEQERIVTKLDELSYKASEVERLFKETTSDLNDLCRSIIYSDKNAQLVPMRDLVRLRSPDVTVEPDEIYQFAGVYSFGRGVFRGQAKAGSQFAYPKLTTVRSGNFTYPKLMAWEGALGIVPSECDGCVVSTEFPVFDVIEERVLPEVLDTYFRTPSVWPALSGASTGTNVRRRRLNPTDFLSYKLPLPTRSTQFRLRTVKNELAKIEKRREEAAIELKALVPSFVSKMFSGHNGGLNGSTQHSAQTHIH